MTIDGLIMTLCYVTRWINYDNCALCSNVHSVPDLQHQKKKKTKQNKTACSLCSLYHYWKKYKEVASATSRAPRSNGWNILPSLIQKLKGFFLPNASHVKDPWKHKKEFKTSTNKENVRNSETTAMETERRKRRRRKTRRKRNRSRRRRWRSWLVIYAGLLTCCFNFA